MEAGIVPLAGAWPRRVLAWLPPAVVVAAALALGQRLAPWQRLAMTSFVLYPALKVTAVLLRPPGTLAARPAAGWLLYLTAWPGMELAPFARRRPRPGPEPRAWARRGLAGMALGLGLAAGLAVFADRLGDEVVGWAGIAALLATFHLGWALVLSALVRRAGFDVGPLFDDPLASRSLTEFWSRRWNLAFVEMDRLLFLPPLRRLLGRRLAVPGVFLASGVMHELAISYPAGARVGRAAGVLRPPRRPGPARAGAAARGLAGPGR
jgi:Membrane bound O-acyl transferase family